MGLSRKDHLPEGVMGFRAMDFLSGCCAKKWLCLLVGLVSLDGDANATPLGVMFVFRT